jgi:hypothetical protein
MVPSGRMAIGRGVYGQEGRLTARQTCQAGAKAGPSDPPVPCGRAGDQRIEATPGITGLSGPSVHSDGPVWHLDVGSSHPGAAVGPKGWAVRPLKRYASWVQNVVRQFGLYPAWAHGRAAGSRPQYERTGVGGPPVCQLSRQGQELGSRVRGREALKASKCEAPPKMSPPACGSPLPHGKAAPRPGAC